MLHIITGPPCAGKSTYVREHAQPGDIRVDFDIIAQALGSDTRHASTGAIREAAFKARNAVVTYCLQHADEVEAWIIHTAPSKWQTDGYEAAGAEFIHLDVDEETCLARAVEDGRPETEADDIRAYFEAQGEKGAEMDKLTKAANDAAQIDGGSVKGYAATFVRQPDSYGDVIAPGAFTKSLERWAALYEQGKRIPLLYGHNMDDPKYNIGAVKTIREDEYGLYVEADFDPDSETAQYVRKLVQEGRLYQFSFAFSIFDDAPEELEDGTQVRELRELDIYEVSLVQIPANQTAVVTEVKAVEMLESIATEMKSGRRNSAKDAAELERIASLAGEITEAVNGLLQAEDGAEATDEQTEGGEADAKGREDAGFVDAYKQAVKQLLKG